MNRIKISNRNNIKYNESNRNNKIHDIYNTATTSIVFNDSKLINTDNIVWILFPFGMQICNGGRPAI